MKHRLAPSNLFGHVRITASPKSFQSGRSGENVVLDADDSEYSGLVCSCLRHGGQGMTYDNVTNVKVSSSG